MLILGVAFGAGQLIHVPGRDGMVLVLAWALVVLAPLDWVAVVLAARLIVRAPDVRALQHQFVRLFLEAFAATMIGASGFNYLLPILPRGAGFVVLVFGLLLVSASLQHWTLETYRKA